MEISTSRHTTGTLVVKMKPRSWKLFWLTISLSVVFVVVSVVALLVYAKGLDLADYKCMALATEEYESFHVELDIPGFSWTGKLTDYKGGSPEVGLPLY